MTPAALLESPLAPPSTLGPYRREDYESLPDHPRHELIYGRLYVTPSPFLRHQVIVLALAEHLNRMADAAGGFVLIAPMDVHLAEHSVVQPDVIYVSRQGASTLDRWIEGAPDLHVEVLSPGSVRRDRGEKLRLYAESGVAEYWIVDPEERQIEFLHNRGGEMTVLLPVDGVYVSPVHPEIRLDVAAFWAVVDRRLQ